MSAPLFSFLIANYNNSRYIKQCLGSVFCQTYTNWEVVLVDDGSTDNFEEVIDEYKDDQRIRVFRNGTNQGCSFTKRKCVELAWGEVAGFLDPDDTIDCAAVNIMMEAHSRRQDCSIVHSTLFICDADLTVVRKADFAKELPPDIPYLLLGDGSIHAFATFKKASYDRTAGLDPVRIKDRAIDQELYYILEEQGNVLFIDQPLYYYRIHSGSISNWGNEVEATFQHQMIIIESCKRRIAGLKKSSREDKSVWIRKYRTRLYKVRVLYFARKQKWLHAIFYAALYPFVGGLGNTLSYIRKLPSGGIGLIRRSVYGTYKI